MTSLQLVDKDLPVLISTHTVAYALEIMQKHTCNFLPVTEGNIFQGMISKAVLLQQEPADTISSVKEELIPAAVNGSTHFLQAVTIASLYRTDVIPVINSSSEYQGSITHIDLMDALGRFCGAGEYGALLVLVIEKTKLNISELNSIVESDGATILHYNISPIAASSIMEVSIGIDKKEISTILASLTRYNYKILFSSGDDALESELSDNYLNLMNYLDL